MERVFGPFWAGVVLFGTNLVLGAETNSDLADEIPPLRPPRGEIPQSFWEQQRLWIILAGILAVALIGLIVWFFTRPRPAIVVPPEVSAREALSALANKPEDGKNLSRISRILRRYLTAAFNLPSEELTTPEFASLLAGDEKIGSDLAGRIGQFLRQCDERKFSLEQRSPLPAALPIANELVELAESRRAYVREQEKAPAVRQVT